MMTNSRRKCASASRFMGAAPLPHAIRASSEACQPEAGAPLLRRTRISRLPENKALCANYCLCDPCFP